MPEQFRDNCGAAVAAGHADNAEDLWYYEQRRAGPNLAVVRQLILSIMSVFPPDQKEIRPIEKRLNDVMRAIFGENAAKGSNAKDDDEILEQLAYLADAPQLDHSKLRGIVRELLLTGRYKEKATESVIRRIVGKFDKERAKHEDRARHRDYMPEIMEQLVQKEIVNLLHSVGVPTLICSPSAPMAQN